MWSVFGAVGGAFGVVFVAELGDKTQLVALGFGAKHRLAVVAAGLACGFAVVGAIAAVVGGVLGATLPQRPISLVGGVLFVGFAAWTVWGLRGGQADDGDDGGDPLGSTLPASTTRSAVLSIAVAIAVAEMGDKTQLATATLAAQDNPVAVWIGSTCGTVSAAMVGATIGRHLGDRLNPRLIGYGSAIIFAILGLALLARAI